MRPFFPPRFMFSSVGRLYRSIPGITGAILIAGSAAYAGQIVFPPGAVINVLDPKYGLVPGSPSTHTPAIQKAIGDAIASVGPTSVFGGTGQYVYLPNGTYAIDSQLVAVNSSGRWMTGLCLVGQSRENTILRLANGSSKFSDTNNPTGVIKWAGSDTSPDGNSGFNNLVMNMTIDVGERNPGASGIDFVGNNLCGVQDVTILSRPYNGVRKGFAGIAMTRPWSGPGLIKNVLIEGFRYGIKYGMGYEDGVHNVTTMTVENLVLRDQGAAGIWTYHSMLSIRGLNSLNSVPALQIEDDNGMAYLLDANLSGSSTAVPAIASAGHLFARNVQSSGYQRAISLNGVGIPGQNHVEFSSLPVSSLFPSPTKSLNLPIREVPEYWDSDLSKWHRVPDPDPTGQADADIINAAIDYAVQNGKTTLWFPVNLYNIRKTIQVHGNIKHIVGMGTHLHPGPEISETMPAMRLSGLASPLKIEHMIFGHDQQDRRNALCIRHESPLPVTFKQVYLTDASSLGAAYKALPGAGNVFIENVGGTGMAKWSFAEGQKIWATQFNIEGEEFMIKNSGADLWIHGLKTEKTGVVIETKGQGRTELIGAILKGTYGQPQVPAFINDASSVSLGYLDSPVMDPAYCRSANTCAYPIQVREKRGGLTREKLDPNGSRLHDGSAYFGTICPLYVGYPVPANYPSHTVYPVQDAGQHLAPALAGNAPGLLVERTEITQESYSRIMEGVPNANTAPSAQPDAAGPVESITFYDAILYCNRRSEKDGLKKVYAYTSMDLSGGHCIGMAGLTQDLMKNGYRLPSESEWSQAYSARTTTPTFWASGDAGRYAWYISNSPACRPSQVAKKEPNPLGIFDMAGNVAEWVWTEPATGGVVMGGYYSSQGSNDLNRDSKETFAKNSWGMHVGFRPVRLAPAQLPRFFLPGISP